MKRALPIVLAAVIALCCGHVARASKAPAPPPESDLSKLPEAERKVHEELIAFRVAIQDAFNKMGSSGKEEDMKPLLEMVHPDCLLTAMNGEKVRGKAGIMDYFHKHMTAPGHYVKTLNHTFAADQLSIMLAPDIAINSGTSQGHYVFTDGNEFKVNTRWTATMMRHEGKWTVVAFQFAPSIFDNPVVEAMKGWIIKVAVIAGIVGLLVGVVVGRMTKRAAK